MEAELRGDVMDDVRMVYSEERNTWNVVVNGEWYFEGNYEQAENVFNSFFVNDDESMLDD